MLDSLIEKKNELIRAGRYADAIDEIIIKVMKAKIKRVRVKESKHEHRDHIHQTG